jgi:hypothetical protein
MRADELLAELQSASIEGRIKATYQLTYEDFIDQRILDSVRSNLSSANTDLIEITIMRLLVRGKDAQSADRVRRILATTRDELVFCAAVSALTNLARDLPETALATLREIEALPRSSVPTDRLAMFDNACAELRHVAQ